MSAEDVSMPKPNSEIYVTAMNKLGVKPEETLILEDNENGIRSAIDSGAHLMRIEGVHDVTYFNIKNTIRMIEKGGN